MGIDKAKRGNECGTQFVLMPKICNETQTSLQFVTPNMIQTGDLEPGCKWYSLADMV